MYAKKDVFGHHNEVFEICFATKELESFPFKNIEYTGPAEGKKIWEASAQQCQVDQIKQFVKVLLFLIWEILYSIALWSKAYPKNQTPFCIVFGFKG